jgi:RNA polymerase sigma-70 factor (ECF subfamily)
LSEKEIIEGCSRGDASAQRELYERFAAAMFGVCCRYASDRTLAEDLLHDGFITVFTKIGEYRGEGSFEGWCRRIFVNTALGFLRRKNPLAESDELDKAAAWLSDGHEDALDMMSGGELLDVVAALPEGYRTILNLYAVEGYSHKEIGSMMGISENTSRSQYFRARTKLMEAIGRNEKEASQLNMNTSSAKR